MKKKPTHIPLRTCLGCGEKQDKYAMIRLVLAGDRGLQIDPHQTASGRGLYLCPQEKCLHKLLAQRRLRRFNTTLTPQQKENLKGELKAMIQSNKIESLVGLANRAGKVALGQQAVEVVIKKRQTKLVILAEDAAPNTVAHFRELANQAQIPIHTSGRKTEWGRLFARENVTVLAILHAGFARTLVMEFQKNAISKE